MRKISLIFTSALLMLCIQGCEKYGQTPGNAPDIQFGMRIADPTGTKALLESDDLFTTGTQVQVYGFATDPLIGHVGETVGSTSLNDGKTLQFSAETGSDPAKWSFVNNNGEQYRWKYQQPHKFFGWLTKDAKSNIVASTFFGSSFAFNASTNVLTIPAKTLDISATNFDFAYSDIVNRGATDADYSTVELPLKHLFSSFSLSARNYSTKQVTIKSIEIHGLQDGKSATINYSGTAAAVNYAGGSVSNYTLLSSNLNLSAAGSTGDIRANVVTAPSDTPAYFLVWPQTDLTYNGTTDGATPPAITPTTTTDNNEPYLKISYSQDGDDIIAYAAIPSDGGVWSAGVRYELELAFQDRELVLGFKAAPWDKMEPVIDYEGAVSVSQKLRLATDFINNCTLSPNFATDSTAYFKPGTPIILEFAIGTPENATWLVGKKLDWDAFDVYNYPDGDHTVNAEGVVNGNLVRIAIDPPTKDLQKPESSLELTFTVRLNNGDMVTIDDIRAKGCPRKFVYIKM